MLLSISPYFNFSKDKEIKFQLSKIEFSLMGGCVWAGVGLPCQGDLGALLEKVRFTFRRYAFCFLLMHRVVSRSTSSEGNKAPASVC